MARSQTSQNIDLLTIADLYTRGNALSTNQTYIPILSTVGAFSTFSKWIPYPISEIFQPLFHDYKQYSEIGGNLSSVQSSANLISSSLHYPIDTVIQFSNANNSTLAILSSIIPSTTTGFLNYALQQSTFASDTNIRIRSTISTIEPLIFSTINTYDGLIFSPTISSLIEQAIYYYIPRSRANEFTYNPTTNPTPLFGGIFGISIITPWYWQGAPTRYIGPGISSISSIFNSTSYPFFNDVNTNFSNILFNISTGLYNSNAGLNANKNTINNTIVKLQNSYDELSSIINHFSNASTIFNVTSINISAFNRNVSTMSSTLHDILSNTTIPSLNGSPISTIILSATNNLNIRTDALIAQLYNQISSGTLKDPLNTFSTIVGSTIGSALRVFKTYDFIPGFNKLSTIFESTIKTFYSPLNSSTLQYGYLNLSSYNSQIFSTVSSSMPNILYSNVFNTSFAQTYSTITTNGLVNCNSQYLTNTLIIGDTAYNKFNMTIKGGTSIQPNILNPQDKSITLPNFNIFTNTLATPAINEVSLYSYNSTIILNGALTVQLTNDSQHGYIGINTLTPGYALDIASGDARKNGTSWVTASDSRMKENISEPLLKTIEQELMSLRLIEYEWDTIYREKCRILPGRVLGFLSQEVEKILPGSVKESNEHGYGNFKSLDVDQLFKLKYGITHNLLQRLSSLTLRINYLMKES